MNAKPQLTEQLVRSKGQATLVAEGGGEFPALIHDISLSELGLLSPGGLSPGTRVEIHTHGHAAHGLVRSCTNEGERFYISIALDAEPEAPAA